MKLSVGAISAALFALGMASCGGSSEPNPLSGTWMVTAKGMASGTVTCPDRKSTYQLAVHGSEVTGSEPSAWALVCQAPGAPGSSLNSFPAEITLGSVDGSTITFTATHSTSGPSSGLDLLLLESSYSGQIDSAKMTGSVTWKCRKVADASIVVFSGQFEAVQAP